MVNKDDQKRSQIAFELDRRQFWKDVYLGVARSDNCINKTVPTAWADQALRDYDKRFFGPAKG